MVTLKCSVVSCAYNSDNCCCKGKILVEGNHAETQAGTYCSSFSERGKDGMHNQTGTPETASIVDCEACNCVYNENRVCRADSIGISGTHATCCEETECASFRCKNGGCR